MNAEAEKRQSFSQGLSDDFIRHYASCIVELEKINTVLRNLLTSIQDLCLEVILMALLYIFVISLKGI